MRFNTLVNILMTVLVILLCLSFAGCGPIAGRGLLSGDRNFYNFEISKSDNSQLLLNIVRLRHLDTIEFLQVSSITAQKSAQGSANGIYAFFNPYRALYQGSLAGGNLNYTDTPTISFTPMQGADFVGNLLTMVSLKSVFYLMNTAWNIEVILRLSMHKINDSYNEVGYVAREKNETPHGYASFLEVIHYLRILQQKNALEVFLDMKGDEEILVFRFNRTRERATSAKIRRLLHLSPDTQTMFWTTKDYDSPPKNTVLVRTRSILQIMSYLANAIVPPPHEKGFQSFYPAKIPGIKIYSSPNPVKANISTIYKGTYYYIKDDDANSKRTFLLFNNLYQLKAGIAGSNSGVMLTLPAGK